MAWNSECSSCWFIPTVTLLRQPAKCWEYRHSLIHTCFVITNASENPLWETEKFVVAVGAGKACLGSLAPQVSTLARDQHKAAIEQGLSKQQMVKRPRLRRWPVWIGSHGVQGLVVYCLGRSRGCGWALGEQHRPCHFPSRPVAVSLVTRWPEMSN